MKTEHKEFPLLTRETLALLERKVYLRLASLEDLEIIDHYMTSINQNDIKEKFLEHGVYSLEEYLYVLKDPRDSEWLRGSDLREHLLDCIDVLQLRVQRGDKIY